MCGSELPDPECEIFLEHSSDLPQACVAAGQFLEGEGKDRLPGFLMFFNTAPFLKFLRQPIIREIINTLLNSIKLN